MASETSAQKATNTFTGGCLCKTVRYSIELPIDQEKTAGRCNCTFCQIPNIVNFRVDKGGFKLLSPASTDELGDYMVPTSPGIHRYFCKNCGTSVFRDGKYEYNGKKMEFFIINLSTFDQPQEGLELSEFKYGYVDGRTGSQFKGTQDKPWKSGII